MITTSNLPNAVSKSDFEQSEIRKREIQRSLEEQFGFIQMVEEPEDWKDIPEFDHNTYEPEEEEFLDFDVDGGK